MTDDFSFLRSDRPIRHCVLWQSQGYDKGRDVRDRSNERITLEGIA